MNKLSDLLKIRKVEIENSIIDADNTIKSLNTTLTEIKASKIALQDELDKIDTFLIKETEIDNVYK